MISTVSGRLSKETPELIKADIRNPLRCLLITEQLQIFYTGGTYYAL